MQNSSPSVHWLKTKRMSKAVGSAASSFSISARPKPWPISAVGLISGASVERAVADGVGDDLLDLGRAVAEVDQRPGHGAVDDLEVAAAGELLELHQREVGLDAGGVAVHDQADGAGGRDHRGLGVAVAVLLAEIQRLVPDGVREVDERRVGAVGVVERHRGHAQALVVDELALGGPAVVADDAEHRLGVGGVAGEGAELARHLGGGGVGSAGHDRGQRAAERAALGRVVAVAHGHQEAADVGVAEAEGAEAVGELGDARARELRHQHGDFEGHASRAGWRGRRPWRRSGRS